MKYGVTWATPDHPVAQTGYVFRTVRAAKRAAICGPVITRRRGIVVDPMCEHGPTLETPLYARIETPEDMVKEVRAWV